MSKPVENLFCKFFSSKNQKLGGLPQEIVNEITSYIYDIDNLRSCSMICRSLYIAAAPHLHYTLTTFATKVSKTRFRWCHPLRRSYKVHLLSLVRRFSVLGGTGDFCPGQFNRRNLRYFSVLKNLRELSISRLKLYNFMPNIRRYFKHFAPTLQSLALSEPIGSIRQILYFIGFFPNLQDFKLHNFYPTKRGATAADLVLTPPSTPPLRGWLTLECVREEKFVDEMIALYGGLYFRCVCLFDVSCGQRVLDACTETLETLQLHEGVLGAFDYPRPVSRFKSLRTLRIIAAPLVSDIFRDRFKTVLSPITSPNLSVIIVYNGPYFTLGCGPSEAGHVGWENGECVVCAVGHRIRFERLCEAYKVRKFQPVFCLEVPGPMVELTMRILEWNVDAHKDGELSYLMSEPIISTIPHICH